MNVHNGAVNFELPMNLDGLVLSLPSVSHRVGIDYCVPEKEKHT